MHETEREAARAAARQAGEVLRRHFRRLSPGSIQEKARNDLVSAADRESEEVLRAALLGAFPQDGFLGEESGGTQDGGRRWIVDPLDGTLNFVQGFAHFCVSVALWDEQGPLVGCVLDPIKQDEFWAVRGGGARWNGEPMRVSQQAGLDGAFVATGFAYQLGERFHRFKDALERAFFRARAVRRAGSAALDLAYLGAGIYDGYFELGLRPWDLAAGVLLVSEAGGVVTDWRGQGGWTQSGDIIAGSAAVHGELLRDVIGPAGQME